MSKMEVIGANAAGLHALRFAPRSQLLVSALTVKILVSSCGQVELSGEQILPHQRGQHEDLLVALHEEGVRYSTAAWMKDREEQRIHTVHIKTLRQKGRLDNEETRTRNQNKQCTRKGRTGGSALVRTIAPYTHASTCTCAYEPALTGPHRGLELVVALPPTDPTTHLPTCVHEDEKEIDHHLLAQSLGDACGLDGEQVLILLDVHLRLHLFALRLHNLHQVNQLVVVLVDVLEGAETMHLCHAHRHNNTRNEIDEHVRE